MNTFKTKSAILPVILPTLIICAVLGIAGAVWAVIQSPPLYALAVCIVLLLGGTAWFTASTVSKQNVRVLTFKEGKLYLTNISGTKQFTVYDVPASDFIITQSEGQKKNDTCNLKIKNTVFKLYSVENCTEMKKYIEENFPEEI